MHYSNGLEYVVSGYNIQNPYPRISYFSKNIDGNYSLNKEGSIILEPQYTRKTQFLKYKNQQHYPTTYANHSFNPKIFLSPSRPKTRFIEDNSEIRSIVEEAFELMLKEKLPSNISINVLPSDEFKAIHSEFGAWSNGILGFSLNGIDKKIFIRENHLDALVLVTGHEIGHVLTHILPNKHDEEAKAFAFSVEWAKTIKKHNVANLAPSIKSSFDFEPARNGLHDVAFSFVDFMVKRGRKAIELHDDLVRMYMSMFNKIYY